MTKIVLVSRCAWTLHNFRRGQISALLADGAEVITGGSGGDGYEKRVEALGVPFVRLPIARRALNPVADLRLIAHMFRWYRHERPDIVHHFTIKPVIYGSIAARLAGVPRIVNTVTGLGYVFSGSANRTVRALVEMQYKAALRSAHFTFFQNETDRDLFVSRGLVHAACAGLLPGSGVDTCYFSPRAVRRPDDAVTFLMVARLLTDKGFHEYLAAARAVRAKWPHTRFLIVGGRDQRNPCVVSMEAISAMEREGIVSWLGEVSDVRDAIASADVVVLPSYREGTPRSLLEASAMGKPIITTDAVGCREAVDDGITGLMVPARDAAALARAMMCLIADPGARFRMGLAGRERMLREFDETIVIARIRDVYTKEHI